MFIRETEAGTVDCCGPEGRGGLKGECLGSKCMAWRWEQLLVNPDWIAVVRRVATEIDDKTPSKAKAAALVNADRARYGLPDKPFRGWCGLAGHPDAHT